MVALRQVGARSVLAKVKKGARQYGGCGAVSGQMKCNICKVPMSVRTAV